MTRTPHLLTLSFSLSALIGAATTTRRKTQLPIRKRHNARQPRMPNPDPNNRTAQLSQTQRKPRTAVLKGRSRCEEEAQAQTTCSEAQPRLNPATLTRPQRRTRCPVQIGSTSSPTT